MGSEHFFLDDPPVAKAIDSSAFVQQYYKGISFVPKEVLCRKLCRKRRSLPNG